MIIEHPPDETSESVETILVFAANTDDSAPLDLEEEVRRIEQGLTRSKRRFRLKAVWPRKGEDLRQALRDHRPAFVHFCGHGRGIGGIALDGQLVGAGALANLFALFADTVRCVVLNACYSEMQANAISRHIEYVVGMNKAIGDKAAIEFASAFYDAIGAGEDIRTAVLFGRNAIELARLPEHLTPELLERNPNGPPRRLSQKDRDWDGAPAVSLLFGREAVAEMLRAWILDDFCRIVLINGMGGVGKSDLASCLGRGSNRAPRTSLTLARGIEGHFDAVLWRSLLNAPPPEELFADVLGVLTDHAAPLPSSPSDRLDAVLRLLHERRCLIVLDNIEAVLRKGDPEMRYRDGFDLYGSFLDRVARSSHQSCLLLTSREKPYPIATLEGEKKVVRSYQLQGIDSGAIRKVFAQIGTFTGSDASWEDVGNMYGGNPLAMELVAHHVGDAYGGDIDAFLGSGQPLFGDVETLLDWHFDRLSERQLEIIDWLAIERVAVGLTDLREELLSRASRDSVGSTLQSLQRRLPLERRTNQQYTLQPVLIEYATARIVRRVADALRLAISEVLHSVADGGATEALFAAMRLLNAQALMKASSPDNVREMQERLILSPIAEEITAEWRDADIRLALDSMLHFWRAETASRSGYAAANILNLMIAVGLPLDRLDVSNLPVWEACLDHVDLHSADFSFADFRRSAFRHAFGTVFCVKYTPDGTIIAAGDDNGHIQMFDAASGELRRTCTGHADVVGAIAFSGDGKVMASGCYDDTIAVWDVAGGHRTQTLLGHEGWVYAVAISPDGRWLVSGSEDSTCRLWDLRTGSWRRLPTRGAAFIATIAFSADGKWLAAAGGGGVAYLFSTNDLEQPRELRHPANGIRSLAFSPREEILATGGENGTVALWRLADGGLLTLLTGHQDNVTSLAFTTEGDLLASASFDKTIRLWEMTQMECVARIEPAETRVWAIHCSPNDRNLVAASEDGTIRVWNIDTRQRLTTLHGYSNKTWGLAYAPLRSRLVVGNEDGVARVWHPRDARVVRELRGHATRIWAVACSPDGQSVATVSDDMTVRAWDIDTGVARQVWRGHSAWIRAVTFNASSQRVVSAGEDGKAVVWELGSDEPLLTVDSELTRLFAVTYCRDSELLAVGGSGAAVRVYSAADGSHLGDLLGHDGWINSLASAGRNALLSCSSDGTARLWDLSSWQCSMTFAVREKVWAGELWPEGDSALTGSNDGVLRRWQLNSGRCVADVRAHSGPIWGVALDPVTRTVATAGDDGVVRLWLLPDLLPYSVPNALRSPRPYEAMNISGAKGLSDEQKGALVSLGALDMPA